MTARADLSYEQQARPRFALMAGGAALAVIAAVVVGTVGRRATVNELTTQFIDLHHRGTPVIASAVLSAIGAALLAFVLVFLLRCAGARREVATYPIWALVAIGAGLTALVDIIFAVLVIHQANSFIGTQETYEIAQGLLTATTLQVARNAGLLASLLLSIAVILVALGAMRVGLLPRAMGYLGIGVGVLTSPLFPAGSLVPIMQALWLLGLAALFSGRWPNGAPPAWQTGTAEPWGPMSPASKQSAGAATNGTGGRGGGRRGAGRAAAASKVEPASAPAPSSASRASAAGKRKRKKRK